MNIYVQFQVIRWVGPWLEKCTPSPLKNSIISKLSISLMLMMSMSTEFFVFNSKKEDIFENHNSLSRNNEYVRPFLVAYNPDSNFFLCRKLRRLKNKPESQCHHSSHREGWEKLENWKANGLKWLRLAIIMN